MAKDMSKSRRILFVDDDELILSCFERLLGRRFDLDVAESPEQALEAVSTRGPYAVVVSDMGMPGMNGIELLSKVKQACPDTVGMLLSGNAEFDEADEAARQGIVFRLIQKPCPTEELIQILEEALARYESATSLPAKIS